VKLSIRFQLYLAIAHLAVLATAAWQYELLGPWFFAVEALVILSWILGARMIAQALRPMAFVQSFSDLLHEREFSARFSPVGQAEMDRLVELYNNMLGELYVERLRLGEQRGFLERFMQATPIGVVIMDFDGRVSLANASALQFLDATVDELTGNKLDQSGSDLAQSLQQLKAGDSRLVGWRGARRLRIEKQAFVDRGFHRLFVLIEELTGVINESERSAYEKLIRLMSHEVNNTIASTNSLLQSCQNYAPQITEQDREDYSNALDVVITRNDHLNRFMRDFAQVVKLPAPAPRVVELEELLEHLRVIYRSQCEERNIAWVRTGQVPAPKVRIDREQMEQVLINVVKNAVEAVDRDGELEVNVEVAPGEVVLSVLDDGCGLEATQRDEVFTPFYTSKVGGQGLGLTLVKEILLKHRFDFSLEANSDGRTRFMIQMGRNGQKHS
jgi:nitrogen fixation/metabolism regulation signal transduction histidine kinase